MKKKLFKVTVTFDMVVAADDITSAEDVAEDNVKQATYDMSKNEFKFDISPYRGNAAGWDNDCFPYGGDGHTRIGEFRK